MHFLISAGSSGGHIYPAIALIKKIQEKKGHKVVFVGTKKGPEFEEIKKLNIEFWAIESYYYDRKKVIQNIKLLKSFINNYFILRKKMKKYQPDVVIGFGGHVTLPVIYTANKMKIKTFIHEQNQIMGRANMFLSKYVNAIFTSYPKTEMIPNNIKTIYTGNPIAERALTLKPLAKSEFNLALNKKLVLILMGSQGAYEINKYLEKNLNNFNTDYFQVLYITGKRNYKKEYEKMFKEDIKVVPYIDDVARIMKQADLIVSRAGASTIAEIMVLKKASLLIPSPYVPNNHQYYNAKYLFDVNAALFLAEKDISDLQNIIEKTINNQSKLADLANNLKGLAIDNSATLIYNNLK